MRHLAVALIVIALLGADFGAYALHFSHGQEVAWDEYATWGVILGGLWFLFRGGAD